jgi:HI0933-like protein
VRPSGTEGYRTAEVTLGGVDTSELSSKTFESRLVPGLYFIGEVVAPAISAASIFSGRGRRDMQWAGISRGGFGRTPLER